MQSKTELKSFRPNGSVIPPIIDHTVLTYALKTNPDTLRVGDSNASLEFIVTNITSTNQAVTSIVFGLPEGDGGITPTTSGIDTELSDKTDWSVSISPPSSGIANVTLTPKNGYSMPINASVVLQLYNMQTVSSPGNTNITITETIGSSQKLGVFQVSIFPMDFFFDGLVASVYKDKGSQLTPVAQVNNGDTVTLTWNSSVADRRNITIYWSDPVKGQQSANPTEQGEWTSPALTCDTVFTVAATWHDDEGQPMTLSRSIAVSVLNPALVAESLSNSTFIGENGNFNFLNSSSKNSSVFSVSAGEGSTTVTINTDQGTNSWTKLFFRNKSNEWIMGTSRDYNNNQFYLYSTTNGAASLTLDVSGNIALNNNVTIAQSLRIGGPSQAGSTPSLSLGGHGNFNVDAPGAVGGRFVVQDGGNVGIGNPNPTSKLSVNGDVHVNGNLKITGAGGKTLLKRLTAQNQSYLEASNIFTTDYTFYEIIFNYLIPSVNNGMLRAQYYINGKLFKDTNAYTCVTMSNDIGGYHFNTFIRSYLAVWDEANAGPQKGSGVNGQMILYDPAGSESTPKGFTATISSPSAYESQPCIIICSGICKNQQAVAGIKFYFDNGNIQSGSIMIYGWN